MAIKHVKVATVADDGTSEVGTDEWNDNHTIDNNTITDNHISSHTTTKITVPTTQLSGTVTNAQLAGSIALSKLTDSPEANATADQTNSEIATAVEAASDSNTFTDTDHSKLNAIEAAADVTDTANVNSAAATTVGTITTGTWQGTTVAVNQGGTGVTASTGTGSTVLSASPTFTGTVTTATVDVAGNNIDNIQNLIHDISVTTVALDFAENELETISAAATLTFTCAAYIEGKSKVIKILDSGSGQTLAFPAGWIFLGDSKPTAIAASKTGVLSLTCFSGVESGVVASYSEEA